MLSGTVLHSSHPLNALQSIRGPKWTCEIGTEDENSLFDLIPGFNWRGVPKASLTAADVSAIVSCCPGLQAAGLCLLPGG